MNPSRIGVIFRSRNTEHEISIVTGMQVISFLSGRYDVVPIYITKDGAWLTGAKLSRIETFKSFNPKDPELQPVVITPDTGLQTIINPSPKGLLGKPKKIEIDVIFPTIHGLHGEDGTIQGLLELANIPYVGSGVLASSICMDKVVTKVVLKGNGLPVLDCIWFWRSDWEKDEDLIVHKIETQYTYPVIVKPARLGSSIGVVVAKDRDELKFNISVASNYDTKILVEPFIENHVEINCSVLGNENPRPSVCEQPLSRASLLTYEDKYLHGQSERGMEGAKRIIPAPISPEMTERIQQMAVDAFRSVDGAGIARVDFLLDKDTGEVYVNELNTLPGSIAFYLWKHSGISPQQLVDELINLAVQKHREKNRTRYYSDPLLMQNIELMSLHKAGPIT